MTIDYSKPGPMTVEQMRSWIAGQQSRKVDDLCLVAWGYHPDSDEGKTYRFADHGGSPERIRNGVFKARREDTLWAERLDDDFFRMDKNDFANWLSGNSDWNEEPACRRFIEAWKSYNSVTAYPDTKPKTQAERVYRAISAVILSQGGKPTQAIKLILNGGDSTNFQDNLRYVRGKRKGHLMSVADALSAYSEHLAKVKKNKN